MDVLAALLMLLAGLLHASWHSLIKAHGARLSSLAGMGAISGVVSLGYLPFVGWPSAAILPILALSILLHAAYKVSLAAAYDRGDLAQAYPLGRGLVPVFAGAIAWLALGESPSRMQALGVAVVSGGILMLARDALRMRASPGLIFATTAVGLAVAGYSVLDGYGVRLSGDWRTFTAWLIVVDSTAFFLIARLVRGHRLWSELNANAGSICISGLLGLISFAVFLWALDRAPVGPVVALKEGSVIFATLIGTVFLRETMTALRAAAIGAIAVGIAIVALSK